MKWHILCGDCALGYMSMKERFREDPGHQMLQQSFKATIPTVMLCLQIIRT